MDGRVNINMPADRGGDEDFERAIDSEQIDHF